MPVANDTLLALRRAIGPASVLSEIEDLIPYSFDGTAALQQTPGCVVLARTVDEVVATLKLAKESKIPVVTRGSGTGLSGGSLPVPGCIVLCLARMDRILELDRANLTLLAEAGATTQAIADAAGQAGLFYPPDPGSMKISTIGGNVAENSGATT
jgi:glycolate oxidase